MTTPPPGWSRAARHRTPTPTTSRCANCREGRAAYPRTDSSGVPGKVCGGCRHLPDVELSFS